MDNVIRKIHAQANPDEQHQILAKRVFMLEKPVHASNESYITPVDKLKKQAESMA